MSREAERSHVRPTSSGPPSDAEIIAYFKRAAATDHRSAQLKERKHPGRYRIVSELSRHIIKTFLKYAKGGYKKCNRGNCRERIVLTDVLKERRACVDCRLHAALHAKDWRAGKVKPRKISSRRGQQKRRKAVTRASSPSDDSSDSSDVVFVSAHRATNANAIADDAIRKSVTESEVNDCEEIPTGRVFTEVMLASVKASYSKFQQITFDERFVVSREHGDTLADTMSIVIEGLRTTLYPVWPRIREIDENNAVDSISNELICTKIYACRCWARGAAIEQETDPSERCDGQMKCSVKKAKVGGSGTHEWRFIRDATFYLVTSSYFQPNMVNNEVLEL
ncbi:hypothetical protein FIBSPDRAFT_890372 [Athelia psychrophila]|uniref:Uncharacterized protein n=1 Tax=Athelia psychrophila TaxID=1759441 RepID=A0A166L1Z5_9AGAM|nr:hypothetical protein FIBSPDRAFT_890369 [Fibularhizoctonia sp. CBS 109695]KZP22490.1 hypothetical protein FIBSPDRAFT_890372 [Fibularhizoctonia sp. CBS 109695]